MKVAIIGGIMGLVIYAMDVEFNDHEAFKKIDDSHSSVSYEGMSMDYYTQKEEADLIKLLGE